MGDPKMHLQILLILWLSQQLFAVSSSNGVLGTARMKNETSLPVNLENKKLVSQDYNSDYPDDDDMIPTTVIIVNSTYMQTRNPIHSFSTGKPMEIVVKAFIPTIRNHDNSTTDPYASSKQSDKFKHLESTLPSTSPEPKNTSQDISGDKFASLSKSTIQESATLLSKNSSRRRTTPFPYILIRSFVKNNTNSSSGFPYITAEEHANTKNPIDLKPLSRSMGQEENFATMSTEQSSLSHNDQDSIYRSLEMTTSLYEMTISDDFKNKTVTTPTNFEYSEDYKATKTKDLLMKIETPNSSIEWKENTSQLSSNDQDLMTGSSEVTLLNKLNLSINLTNETGATVKVFQSPGQNNESVDSFLSKRQDKSAEIENQQQDANVLSRSVTTSPFSLNSSSEFSDLSMHNLASIDTTDTTISISENGASSNPDQKFNSEITSETASTTLTNQKFFYETWSEPTDTDLILSEDATSFIIKEDEEYTVTVPKICTNISTINRLLHLLNVSPNSKRIANFTCENLKDMTIAIKSKELFYKINELLKAEAKTDDMVFIKVSPNATIAFEIHSQSSPNGVFIPMVAIVIFGCVALFILLVILCVSLYKMKCCKQSTSLDLYDIPHLNLKTDFNLTPIPRPSISFPDNNRDFLHAYATDNYSLSRPDNTLHKRSCSGTIAKTYEEVQKEIGSRQEMQTFTTSSGKKGEFKASRSQNYPSDDSWDHLQENNYSKKYGVANPGYRRW